MLNFFSNIDNQTLLIVAMFILLLMNFFLIIMRTIYKNINGLGYAVLGNVLLLISLLLMYIVGYTNNHLFTIFISVLDLLGMNFLIIAIYVFFNNRIKIETYIIINLLNLLIAFYYVAVNNNLSMRRTFVSLFIFIIFIDGAIFLRKKYIDNNLLSYKVIKYILYIFAGYYLWRIFFSYFNASNEIIVFNQNAFLSMTLIVFMFFSVLITFALAFMTIDTLFNDVKALSIRDSLTGLYNRRYLLCNLESFLKEVKRGGHSFLIVLLDIDSFKEINDTYGHNTGDKILLWFSKLLEKNLREADIVGRYGGDEFIAILKDTRIDDGYLIFERILNQSRNSGWNCEDIKITFSASIMEVNIERNYQDIHELINDVDREMYAAKKEGRNRILKVNTY